MKQKEGPNKEKKERRGLGSGKLTRSKCPQMKEEVRKVRGSKWLPVTWRMWFSAGGGKRVMSEHNLFPWVGLEHPPLSFRFLPVDSVKALVQAPSQSNASQFSGGFFLVSAPPH
jgi:hypothetical protein